MSFLPIEKSREDGRPVGFYRFILGAQVWRYTSGDEDIVLDGFKWQRAAISDDGVKQTGDTVTETLTISCPWWIGPIQVFVGGTPSVGINVTIFDKHEQSPELFVRYIGEVVQVNPLSPGTASIQCDSLISTMNREGLRLGWQRSCPYVIYDPTTCRLDRTPFGRSVTVLSIDGVTITVAYGSGAAIADGRFDGGFIEWSHPIRGTEFLAVDKQVANSIQLFGDPGDLHVGATGTVFPTCKFEPVSCQAFGNYDNYGGVPDLPGRSPFDGKPIF